MSALLFILLFAVVFVAVGGVVGWVIEVALFRWIERRYGVKLQYSSPRSPAWIISGAKSGSQIWIISALHVAGIVLSIGIGIVAGFAVLLWALPVFR
jgi:hypothetical protein